MSAHLTVRIKAAVPVGTRSDVGALLILQQTAKHLLGMPGVKPSDIERAARWLAESYEAGEGEAR